MHYQLANILVFALIGAFIVFFLLAVGSLLRPHHPSAEKLSPYECGERPVGSPWIRFNIRFYIIALVFIVFDVEIALIYPCAVVYKQWLETPSALPLGGIAFGEMLFFVAVLAGALAYLWRKGDLEWIKSFRRGAGE